MKKKLKIIIPLVLLLLLVGGLTIWYFMNKRITQEQQDMYTVKINEAQASYQIKEYSLAINKYYEATEIIPSGLNAYEGIVNILLLKNRPADAQNIVKNSATSLSSDDKSKLYVLLGDYYYAKKDFSTAKDMYQSGIGLGVENMSADLKLGKALLNTGKITEAKRQFELGGYKEDEQIEANLLLSYMTSNSDNEKAKSLLNSVNPSGNLNILYEEFRNVLNSLDTDKKYNASKLSRIFLNNGYPYLAVNILEPMQEDISEYIDGIYFLGRAYLEAGQYQKSLETLDKALALGGMESDISWTKARAYYLSNDLDSAIKNYSNAISYAGKDVSKVLVTEYIDILLEKNQYLKATEVITSLLTVVQEPYVYLLGIKSNYEFNDSVKVDYYLERLDTLTLSEDETKEYLYWNIKVKLKNENYEGMDSLLDTLLAVDKYNPRYYLLLGRYYVTKTDSQGAKQSLEKAIEYDLNNLITEEASKLLSNIE